MITKERRESILFYSRTSASFGSFFKIELSRFLLKWRKRILNKPVKKSTVGSVTLNFEKLGRRSFYYRTYSGDLDIFHEIFYNKIYDLAGEKTFSLIIDAGSHIGIAALFFLENFSPSKIICIEPDEENYAILQKNLSKEIAEGKVIVIRKALMGVDKKFELQKGESSYDNFLKKSPTQNINAGSISEIISKFPIDQIDLLKMDIEDSEKIVFADDTDWIGYVNNIFIEIHSKESKAVFLKEMNRFNFSVTNIPGHPTVYFANRTSSES